MSGCLATQVNPAIHAGFYNKQAPLLRRRLFAGHFLQSLDKMAGALKVADYLGRLDYWVMKL